MKMYTTKIKLILIPKSKLKKIALAVVIFLILQIFGIFSHLFEKDFYTEFTYPYDVDLEKLVNQLRNNVTPDVDPINLYNFQFRRACEKKCSKQSQLRLVYVAKSAPENVNRRTAIRRTWGHEKRFSDVEIRTVFLLGSTDTDNRELQNSIEKESNQFGDIVQANFTDSYFNNTFKTMMGFHWAIKYCPNSRFYMFVDDDYYVSTKNVLRFIRNPLNYPKYLLPSDSINIKFSNLRNSLQAFDFDLESNARLYAGYVFVSSPHRHLTSKWWVSLSEYPFHMWPPYVTAGAYVLSQEALTDMVYASYYTKHFRFDDIYVGLLAFRTKIDPLHNEEFHFYKKSYTPLNYKYTIASHGYGNSDEMIKVWVEQKSLGNA